MLEFLNRVKDRNGKANLYVLDANGYSPLLLARLLSEFDEFAVIPDSMILCNFSESCQIESNGISIIAHAEHGYPAKGLILKRKFLIGHNSTATDTATAMADYIAGTFATRKDRSTAFVFVQDKNLIINLADQLNEKGFSTLIATSSSRKSQEEINGGGQDVIIGTSSVSRGLDFHRPHKPLDLIYVLIEWGVEQNLVETIQAISRARGGPETERGIKEIHLLYSIPDEQERVIENLASLVEFGDKEVIRLIYRAEHLRQKLILDDVVAGVIEQFFTSPKGKALVPIPAQNKTVYKPNRISEYERIMVFLEDVAMMERGRNPGVFTKIKHLISILSSAITFYTCDVPSRHDRLRFSYYHPYILIENATLYFTFDGELRRKAIELMKNQRLRECLRQHSEEDLKRLEAFLSFPQGVAPVEQYAVPILLPVYSVVLSDYVLEENKVMEFTVRKRVGSGATVLGSRAGLTTRCCVSGNQKEYAVIPLGEDYCYKEVLSGRFAKFPVEFVERLLRGTSEEKTDDGTLNRRNIL